MNQSENVNLVFTPSMSISICTKIHFYIYIHINPFTLYPSFTGHIHSTLFNSSLCICVFVTGFICPIRHDWSFISFLAGIVGPFDCIFFLLTIINKVSDIWQISNIYPPKSIQNVCMCMKILSFQGGNDNQFWCHIQQISRVRKNVETLY